MGSSYAYATFTLVRRPFLHFSFRVHNDFPQQITVPRCIDFVPRVKFRSPGTGQWFPEAAHEYLGEFLQKCKQFFQRTRKVEEEEPY